MKKPPTGFEPKSRHETEYARALRKVARHVGHIVESHTSAEGMIVDVAGLDADLLRYGDSLTGWASKTGAAMVSGVDKSSQRAYSLMAQHMGGRLKSDLTRSMIGAEMQRLHAEQVELIKSIPAKAAERAQKLARESVSSGARAAEIADEIKRTTDVTESRATLIARTEVAKAHSALTQARAKSVGSNGYIWRTARDGDVRESHAEMEGQYVDWSDPPELDGMVGHAGEFPNCRCYPEPILPDS